MSVDIEDIGKSKIDQFLIGLLDSNFDNDKQYRTQFHKMSKKYKICPKKIILQAAYHRLVKEKIIQKNPSYEKWGVSKKIRSSSGVLVVTVFTAKMWIDQNGQKKRFDCAYDCHYCPDEPGQPRSYLSTEPGVMRAIENDYHPIRQFDARLQQLVSCGHTPDKIEILVLGGTWSSYPIEYRENFIRDIYYAANTWTRQMIDDQTIERVRQPDTLLAERTINETVQARIIGVTLETRPDQINKAEMRHFRRCGCTRVQLGVQHTDDKILKKINRRCSTRHTVRALRFLKNCGFKVDIHLMPDLPGSSIEIDRQMFIEMLNNPDLQADQWKIYPTAVTDFTKIKEWYQSGDYIPYAETDFEGFMDLLIWVMERVHPWIRLNRVIRDIPERSILGGNKIANLRNYIEKKMNDQGKKCLCVRSREIRDSDNLSIENVQLTIRKYAGNQGTEYYLSYEDPKTLGLYGHLRLRINEENMFFPELSGCGLIRELHVYGKIVSTDDKSKHDDRAQHHGLGTRLVKEAERIILQDHGLNKSAVISGDGVKPYYRKLGYRDVGDYLIKDIE